MGFLKDFGINPILLLAQVVNFTILVLLLKKFFYKPILKILEERKTKIETSVKRAEEIEKKLAETQMRQEEIIGSAESQATKIIEEAKEAAKKLEEQMQEQAGRRVEETFIKAKADVLLEKQKMVSEVKSEMASLVAETTKMVLGKALTSKDNEEMIKKSMKELK